MFRKMFMEHCVPHKLFEKLGWSTEFTNCVVVMALSAGPFGESLTLVYW